MYSCNKYNIFARKSRTNCLEVNSKGYMEFEQPSRAHFQRYPLLQQILMGVVRGMQFPLFYSASGTAGIVKQQCQILMESEMFRLEKHNYSISLNPFKQLKTKWRKQVKPSFILDKIVRLLFVSSVIQLIYFTSCDVIVALTCDFVVAKHQTFIRVLNPFCFTGVTLENLSTHRLLSWVTLGTSSHQQRDK